MSRLRNPYVHMHLHMCIHAAAGAQTHVIAMTDVGVRALDKGALPPLALFVHFDLPTRKVCIAQLTSIFTSWTSIWLSFAALRFASSAAESPFLAWFLLHVSGMLV